MIEGLLHDGISCLAPQVINDHIYLGLAPDWMYGLHGPSFRIKVDWTGRILWEIEFSEDPCSCSYPIITATGLQFVLFEKDNKKTLMCLTDHGEVKWKLQENWLNKLAPWMYSLPDDCVLLAEVTTKPAPGGLLSKLYVVNSDGKVTIKRNNFLQTAAQNDINANLFAYNFHQSPICLPQRSLIFFPPCLSYLSNDIPPQLIHEPQTIALYDPLTDNWEKKEFLVGDVNRFLYDEKQQVLYICADKKQDDISRIDFRNGSIQFHTYHNNYDTRNPCPPALTTPPDVQSKGKNSVLRDIGPNPDFLYHCLPVVTECGDVIFCHSGTTVVCISSEWKEKWKIELPKGACDMKLAGNLLFIMIYNEVEHRAELHKFTFNSTVEEAIRSYID